ncbi:unnamed protein product [Anisakis simplex]|uniref:Peptidase A1 domain-containing protein n=1 Tax=Anisakis simplex TaxID=6269 RepID=A0A3P6RVW7_ANISI|nr:unnamed protein product [Anisakis simplex]
MSAEMLWSEDDDFNDQLTLAPLYKRVGTKGMNSTDYNTKALAEYAISKHSANGSLSNEHHGFNQPLINYENIRFMGEITIGTPPQRFTMWFDTSSHGLWVPCEGCFSESCFGRNKFSCWFSSTCSSFDYASTVDSGQGFTWGYFMEDVVCVRFLNSTPSSQFVHLI